MKQKLLFLITLFIFSNSFAQLDLGDDIFSCEGETILLDATISASDTVLYEWYLGGTLIPNNLEPVINVTQTGNYTAVLYIGPNDQDTDSVNVTFNPADDASFFMTPTIYGATATVTGELGGVFSFNPIPADGAVIDATTGEVTGAITDNSYCVEYITNGICPSSTISCFIANPSVIANQPSDLLVCDDNQDGFAQFDLTLVNAEVLGSQNASDFMVNFYETQADALAGNNTITNANNFINTNASSQTVYVRVIEISTSNYNTTSFSLIVNAAPQAFTPFNVLVCQNEPVFLNDFISFEILGNQNPNDFTVSYYYNLSDANAQINPINANEPFYDFFITLFAVVNANTTNCASNPLAFFMETIFIDYIYPSPLY
ncbi:MAG: immunoglobulin domain-containing protein, partial [Oceanihabitans sp.]|nr:immunoglobulin domain-containing protein [Oceanihabitans sp.]